MTNTMLARIASAPADVQIAVKATVTDAIAGGMPAHEAIQSAIALWITDEPVVQIPTTTTKPTTKKAKKARKTANNATSEPYTGPTAKQIGLLFAIARANGVDLRSVNVDGRTKVGKALKAWNNKAASRNDVGTLIDWINAM